MSAAAPALPNTSAASALRRPEHGAATSRPRARPRSYAAWADTGSVPRPLESVPASARAATMPPTAIRGHEGRGVESERRRHGDEPAPATMSSPERRASGMSLRTASLLRGYAAFGRCVTSVTERRAGTLRHVEAAARHASGRRGLFESRSRAAAAVMAGEVRLGERPARKPGQLVADDAELEVAERPAVRLARGREAGQRAGRLRPGPGRPPRLDAGASTGGFTDCLLQRGAERRDRARRGLRRAALALRQDPRVTVIERRNARPLERGRAALRAGPDRGRRLLHLADQGAARRDRLRGAARSTAWRWSSRSSRSGASVGKGGVVRSPDDRRAALVAVAGASRRERGVRCSGFASSGLPGPAGNRESFVWLAEAGRAGGGQRDLEAAARKAEP